MPKTKGVNSTTLKRQNRASILITLRNYGSMSRKDLAEHIRLTPAAVTILVNEMMDEGILVEKGVEPEGQVRAGRKKILIDINAHYKYVVAVNISKKQVDLGIYNIRGKLRGKMKMVIDPKKAPKKIIQDIANRCMKFLWENNLTKEQVLGMGVSIVGLVNKDKGISKKAYGLWKEQVPLKKWFEDSLGLQVVVENNVRALAMAELETKTNQLTEDLLFIKYGPGIGSVLILNKLIHYGYRDLAGELGHITMEVDGKECRCGKKGCLETVASEEVVLEEIRGLFSKEKTPILYEICKGDDEALTTELIGQYYPKLDKSVNVIINHALTNLALALSNSITFVDPAKVVIYGKFFNNNEVFNALIKQLLFLKNDYQESYVVEKSILNEQDPLVGPYIVAIKDLFLENGGLL